MPTLLGTFREVGRWRKHIYAGVATAIEQDCGMEEGSFLKLPWNELPAEAIDKFLNGMGERHITYSWRHSGGIWKHGNLGRLLPGIAGGVPQSQESHAPPPAGEVLGGDSVYRVRGDEAQPQARAVVITSRSAKGASDKCQGEAEGRTSLLGT